MTKAELIEKVHKEHGSEFSKKAVSDLVEGTFAQVAKAIKKEKRFGFPGFGFGHRQPVAGEQLGAGVGHQCVQR